MIDWNLDVKIYATFVNYASLYNIQVALVLVVCLPYSHRKRFAQHQLLLGSFLCVTLVVFLLLEATTPSTEGNKSSNIVYKNDCQRKSLKL